MELFIDVLLWAAMANGVVLFALLVGELVASFIGCDH